MTLLARCLPLFVLLLAAGCDQPAPVELIDRQIGSPELELLNEPGAALLGMEDVDSTRFFPPESRKAFAHLLISGSVYDGLFLHAEATLARAIFYDRSAPVLGVRGDTVAYRTIDVGALSIDGHELRKHPKRLTAPWQVADTTLGVQYSLVSEGLGGIAYEGDRLYRWQNPLTTLPSPIDASIQAPAAIRVTHPAPANTFRLSSNLPVRWSGGSGSVKIVISDVRDGARPKPLLRMRVRRNRGETVIPSTILGLLPSNREGFLFTFSSDRSLFLRVDGYAEDVLVQGTTSHSLYLQCAR